MRSELARFRRWLLLWYFGASAVALTGFAASAFWLLTDQLRRQTDAILRSEVRSFLGDASQQGTTDRALGFGSASPRGPIVFLTDERGQSVSSGNTPVWIAAYVRVAVADGEVLATHLIDDDDESGREVEHLWRVYGKALAPDRVVLAVMDLQGVRAVTRARVLALSLAGAVGVTLLGFGGVVFGRRAVAPAESVFDGMKRFASHVAHELRTPMSLIQNQAEVALQQPREGPRYRQALTMIRDEANRLGHVVESLSTLARAETDAIIRQSVALDDIVFESLPNARRLAQPAGITVDVAIEDAAVVWGDPVLLRQSVLIFVDNAVRHASGSKRIIIRARTEGGEAVIEVADQGPGISPSLQQQLLLGSTRGEHRVGIGLSIAQFIARSHAGRVDIGNAPAPGGAIVGLRIPVIESS